MRAGIIMAAALMAWSAAFGLAGLTDQAAMIAAASTGTLGYAIGARQTR